MFNIKVIGIFLIFTIIIGVFAKQDTFGSSAEDNEFAEFEKYDDGK